MYKKFLLLGYTYIYIYFFFFFCFFRAAPEAYGSPQARGLIRAVATGLRYSSRQRWIFNPQGEARDRTHHLIVPSRICFCYTMMGTPCTIIS